MTSQPTPQSPSPFTPIAEYLEKHKQTIAPRDSSTEYYRFAATLPPAEPPTATEPSYKPRNKYQGTIFSIPRAARNKIYRHLLVTPYTDNGIYITGPNPTQPDRPGPPIPQSLFLVNHKFSVEASAIFYAENAFRFTIPTQDLNPYCFHPSLYRVRKCWLDIEYPFATATTTWADALKKRNRTENLIRAFANCLEGDHYMQWLQIVTSKPDHTLDVNWHSTLEPLSHIRHIKKVYTSGRLDPRFRDYLEDVITRDEAWPFISLEDWTEQTDEWKQLGFLKEKGTHVAARRIDLFREIYPELEPTPKMVAEKQKREMAAQKAKERKEKEEKRGRVRPHKVVEDNVAEILKNLVKPATPTPTPTRE
jgi:hypothetical protein